MAANTTLKRITKEAAELQKSPSPDFVASPIASDLFEWHFTLRGPPSSPYASGQYHGRISLPPTYPYRPPSFRFLTPSGRFETNREICLSISGHHEETWQPAWGIRTALVALRSFMETDVKGQLGGMECSEERRKNMAEESCHWRCGVCGMSNAEIMADATERCKDAPQAKQDVVPDELKMGFRDELEKPKQQKQQQQQEEEEREIAEMAEGFVQTAPPVDRSQAEAQAQPSTRNYESRPIQAASQPISAQPTPTQTVPVPEQPTAQMAGWRNDNGVPVWLDRLIVALVVFLVALLMRIMYVGV
ncbi:ubiquitin-conjugating enzyme/RWD-like protein [Emericellopsis atlantica]|uniref:Ubiquitin-conjugating enzyme/RWD-like protein n=1 Tax=Emericellopsis atlantica TaxID=2614577 RepID=A0A9P7ZU61_9HYPO|nr:ubiquitin-conjugating enzyme/RWD-like protein [Emericellopsis atlantica]KAG9258325.1 ubiquitin-conjugating enzyme/RWD-like protein [Emericellopsis atlantica]